MKNTVGFLKLIRPINLFIIVFTMVAIRCGVINGLSARFEGSPGLQMDDWKFGLSVLVMVLLAAAGNIINDYFDVRVDRINKPEKVIVGKLVKRRVAMITHHSFNALAVIIGFYLAWDSGQYLIALLPILMGTLLWFYSLNFKKLPWIGNFVVALLVGVVPIWAGIFEIPLMTEAHTKALLVNSPDQLYISQGFYGLVLWLWVIGVSIFAFWLTLIREVVKDLEDIRGDHMAGFRTLPIVWGIKKTKVYVYCLYTVFTIGLFWATPLFIEYTNGINVSWPYWVILILGVGIPALVSFVSVFRGTKKSHFKKASVAIKVIMLSGITIGYIMQFWR